MVYLKRNFYLNNYFTTEVWNVNLKKNLIFLFAGGVETCKKSIYRWDGNLQKKWSSVRDYFRRINQKRKTASGQTAINHKKYKLENLLDFLLPHITEWEIISNVTFTEDNQEDDDEETESVIAWKQVGGDTIRNSQWK